MASGELNVFDLCPTLEEWEFFRQSVRQRTDDCPLEADLIDMALGDDREERERYEEHFVKCPYCLAVLGWYSKNSSYTTFFQEIKANLSSAL